MSLYSLLFSQIIFKESTDCFEEDPIHNIYLQENLFLIETKTKVQQKM